MNLLVVSKHVNYKKDLFVFVNLLKNGITINKPYIDVPFKMYFTPILEILIDYGFIYKYEVLVYDRKQLLFDQFSQYKFVRIYIKYWKHSSMIHSIIHPGNKIKKYNIFVKYCDLQQLVLASRLLIVSTSFGIKAFTSQNIGTYSYGGVLLLKII